MPRAVWALVRGRPVIEVVLTLASNRQQVVRPLLADTGAGAAHLGVDLVLEETDCLLCGGKAALPVRLGGAFAGQFPTYVLRVQLPVLAFDHHVRVVGVSAGPRGLRGIACFPFLNRFTYGNFGDPSQFGLES